ncbi:MULTISPECIES: acyl-CoA synthetase [Microbacterium]|uniref:Long-chain-fatty-acid--CoA ligase n=1 Tax=Microbacterium wangchenii TaxID=2541726 RepID=A0ABX5SVS2_9MICO|nr:MULTISPECIES: long-chain fatty acid--CoA ligase [Microbacterium]MCK6065993.1 long-chain fatty acid--CoA ligase [Microbacterium sp. EYE_512]QBR90285.1 long-chain-fatty-acid--CoA ligase [Microbacterium wangchenii]
MHNHGLGSWMAKRRLKSPEKTALVFDGRETTYSQLADAADRVSAVLRQRGVGKGDRVAYLGENSPEFLQVLFGTVQLGAVFVPVNTRLAPPEVTHVLTDSGAVALIHDPEFTERVAPGVAAGRIAHVLVTGEGSADAAGLAPALRSAPGGHADADVELDDPAAIIYTSGTTGRPKGAILSHGNLTWVSMNCIVDYDVVSADVALLISPLFHVASLGMGALPVILKGATIVLEKGFEPGRALAQIQRHGVTMLSGVPTTYQLMADHPEWAATDLSTLAKLTCGGSAVPTRILNAYEERGLSFSQGYGMTETSPGATSLAPHMTRAKQGSVGVPHFFTDVRIADEHGAMVPRGTVGEIEISGPNVFLGYHGLPEASADAFTADGWFRSGDLGYLDGEGYLFIADRLKDMIISGGENIYPAEVENLVSDIEHVTGVAVIGVPDERWGEVPWAVVTVRDGASVDTETVRAHLDGKIARYKIPKNTIVVDELPRTASGKVRKGDLRARYAPRAADAPRP